MESNEKTKRNITPGFKGSMSGKVDPETNLEDNGGIKADERKQNIVKKCEEKKRAENDYAVGIALDNEGREHDVMVKVPETVKQIAPGAGNEGTSKRVGLARPGGQKAKSSNIDPEVIKSLYRKRYPQMTNEQVVKATKTYIEQTRGKVRKGETSAYEEQMRRQEMLKQEILSQQIQVSRN